MADHPRPWWAYEPDRDPQVEADSIELGPRVAESFGFASVGHGILLSPAWCSVRQFTTGILYAQAECDAMQAVG
jgi:hypothetical protein